MIRSVLFLGQVPRRHERNSDGITENHLDRRGSDRSEIEGAQFSLQRQMHVHVTNGSERIALNRGEGDQVRAFSANARDEAEELVGVAGLAEEDDDVGGGENADVAVEGVDGGEEGGADAEGDEGLGDLVGDEAGLADAGEEDGAGGGEEGASES